jgi:hypothetical protein
MRRESARIARRLIGAAISAAISKSTRQNGEIGRLMYHITHPYLQLPDY